VGAGNWRPAPDRRDQDGQARTVSIGADGVELLGRYRATLAERMGCDPDGWLFSYNGGETPIRAKSMTEYFTGLAKRVRVPATLHTLRHWASSELQHLGVDLPTAAARTGHSVEVMASTYLHTTDERGAAAGELIPGMVAEAIGAS
jgi:integrase